MSIEEGTQGPRSREDWERACRAEYEALDREALQARIESRLREVDEYVGQYGEGNSIANDARREVGIMQQVLEQKERREHMGN